MESTGKYRVPVFNLLEDQINAVIANPEWVKAVKGNKDSNLFSAVQVKRIEIRMLLLFVMLH